MSWALRCPAEGCAVSTDITANRNACNAIRGWAESTGPARARGHSLHLRASDELRADCPWWPFSWPHRLVVTAVTGSPPDQLVRGDAVGDEHIHPASEKGAAQCGQFADATGDRDPARDRHQLLRPDSDHFLVELGFDEGARGATAVGTGA
jgi:hypothetical protein